jgi:mono/diheme cytochrome c family protein
MPNFTGQVSEEQLSQLIAYIKSIGGPQPASANQSSGPTRTATIGAETRGKP